MKKIKDPSVQGKFYTDNKDELISELKEFQNNLKNFYPVKTRAVIVPHAGYYFSGQLAFEGINYLSEKTKNIFIFAPSHRIPFEGITLTGFDEWSTLLGNIPVNQEINKTLQYEFSAKINDEAYKDEHAVEIQLPIIQTLFKDIKIIPVLIGHENFGVITDIINYFWEDETNSFVISSDLSHFLCDNDARNIDKITANMIEEKDIKSFNHQQACGAIGILGLVNFALKRKFNLIRVGLINSADKTGDTTRVVGYGSWILYENSKNQFLKDYFTDLILEICKKSIREEKVDSLNIPPILEENGASFVTLELDNKLRGCIGSIIAYQALLDDLISNAKNAAFKDPRFSPVTKSEIEKLEIFVSLLSTPEKMNFKDENDLLNQIQPFIDGIIIKDGKHQAVYLPSVWEQLSNKKEFLNSLKVKAGLPWDYFSPQFEAYHFTTEYLKK